MSSTHFGSNDFSSNPYQPIDATAASEAMPAYEMDEQARTLRSLSNWQTCFAVVGFLGTGLLMLLGVFQAIFMMRGGAAALSGIVVGVMMLVMGFFCYLLPSILVMQAAISARAVANSGPSKLTQFLKAQRAFWRYCGIVMLVVFVVYFGFFIVLLLFGLSGVSRSGF